MNEPIRHGMFIMPFHPPEKPLEKSLEEDLELVILAEQLGFTEFWIGEHHTMKYETIVMPEVFIARALGETSTIRLGAAPVCLNQQSAALWPYFPQLLQFPRNAWVLPLPLPLR